MTDLVIPLLGVAAVVVTAIVAVARLPRERTFTRVQTIVEINDEIRDELARLKVELVECRAERTRLAGELAAVADQGLELRRATEALRVCRRRQERLEHRLIELGEEPTHDF